MDDHTGREEQDGLERTVREEVEDGGSAVADGEGAGHVAELADRRVGEHALDVVLCQCGESGADHRDGGHHGEDDEGGGGGREDGEEPGDEVDAGGDHRRGVDQRGDGVGPAIASGSQVCRGNCADLPATPARSSRAMRVG